MTLKPESQCQTRSRARTRIRSCRLSPCCRHPDDPVTGICASCLRERLSGLDSSAAAIAASFSPELRRCRSMSTSKCEASCSSFNEQRRKSYDVRSDRSSLAHLFGDDDEKNGSNSCSKVESKNLGLSRVTYTVIEASEEKSSSEEIRVSRNTLVAAVDMNAVDDDEEGEFKTMKEYIDLEFQNKNNKSKDLRGIAGSLLGAASVFTKKLQKWRQKNKMKKGNNNSNCETAISHGCNDVFSNREKSRETQSEIGGRRSCDTEPRFSIDAGRISFDEPRASWDGYMIARTIPRLAPMFSVVENGVLGNGNRFENHRLSVDGPMHSIMEDETSSGGSGNYNSDSSSMMRSRSSFDRSSSVRSFGKKTMCSEDHGVSPANLKLVITERELKDWHMNSNRNDALAKVGSISKRTAAIENVGNWNVPKKSFRWLKVRNVFSFKPKNCEDKSETFFGNVIDSSIDDPKQGKEAGGEAKEVSGWKLTRSSSVVGSRNSCEIPGSSYGRRSVDNIGVRPYKGREEFMLERNSSAKYSSMDLDNGIVPFYMTPLRSIKGGKCNLENSNSFTGNVMQLS
ncbi:Hypothetical predicted protein [Olea europaea subsp. europaea]|uniref:Uncharacterized protein n=1 Tax=Olea europaea subsp. europaea TaxID=158383 RepID=A0A8S0RK83_OLEEU|nr:Hypothetical predicted protein [Olea europaea subsp. europaea]